LTHDPQVSHPVGYIAWDVIVSEKKELNGKIGGGGFEFARSIVKFDATLFDEAQGIIG
jgi:hypothetical protein